MSPYTDITENNASNLHLATPEAQQLPEFHAIFQSVATMRAFLTDAAKVDDPLTDAQVDAATKNDLIFHIREIYRLDGIKVTEVEITGDSSVEEEDSIQLTATATYSPGYEVDVTNIATWASSDDTKAEVEAGFVTGIAAGSTNITATLKGVSSTNFAVTVTS